MGRLVTPADRKMAETVSAYWVRFAKTGDPNGPRLPEWPAYKPATDRLLELGPEITVRQHFRKEQLDTYERLNPVKARYHTRVRRAPAPRHQDGRGVNDNVPEALRSPRVRPLTAISPSRNGRLTNRPPTAC